MRGGELAGSFAGTAVAEAGKLISIQVVDCDAGADVGVVGVDVEVGEELADVNKVVFDVKSTRAVEVAPLVEEIAF